MDTASTTVPRSPRTWALTGVLFAACGYAALVSVVHLAGRMAGSDTRALETHLVVVGLLGIFVLQHAIELGFFALGFVLYAAWRWYRDGFKASAFYLSVALALIVLAEAMVYAHAAGTQAQKDHAKALAEAVAQGDRKNLREVVFRCNIFCGYEADIGPVVWLVHNADSDADFNAIGKMLKGQNVPRNTRSKWLPDRRTPLEAAVDRYATHPQLAHYLVGITDHHHFQLFEPAQHEKDAILLYAVKKRAPVDLLQAMVKRGAQPRALVDGETAYVTAQNLEHAAALALFDRAARGSLP